MNNTDMIMGAVLSGGDWYKLAEILASQQSDTNTTPKVRNACGESDLKAAAHLRAAAAAAELPRGLEIGN